MEIKLNLLKRYQKAIYLYAGITGDMNPIHINCELAEKSFAGKRIAHGGLVEGLISTVIGMYLSGSGTIYMEQNSKFVFPVFIGDTITAKVIVESILNKSKGIVKLSTIAYNQKNKIVIIGYAVAKAVVAI